MTFENAVLDRETMLGRAVPSATALDLELMTLQSVFPEAMEHLPAVFEESVTSSVANILGTKDSKRLFTLLRGTDLGDQQAVFAAIDRLSPHGGSLIKSEIAAEFHAKVRALFKRAVASQIDSDELLARKESVNARLGI